jgi:DNA-binding LytR/AlgR family response regulator
MENPSNSKFKILIVEDNKSFANELCIALKQKDCEILEIVDNYNDAIRVFEKDKPHFVMLDIELVGNENGIAVARYINRTCRVPFIYLSDKFNKGNPYFNTANATMPDGYLPKGLVKPEAYWHFIDLALENYIYDDKKSNFFIKKINLITDFLIRNNAKINPAITSVDLMIRGDIFYKNKVENTYEKLDVNIVYAFKSENHFVHVIGKHGVVLIKLKSTLTTIMQTIDSTEFVKLSKAVYINMLYFDKMLDHQQIRMKDHTEYGYASANKASLESRLRIIR